MAQHQRDRGGEVVTGLLHAWRQGDLQARDELLAVVYADLRRRAAACLRRERPDHTLEPTALVHEAFLRLVDQERVDWQNRAHFFGIAAQMMRRILVDHARARGRGKRGGALEKITLTEHAAWAAEPELDLLALDRALKDMASVAPRHARIVELRYFAGLSEKEVAEVLGTSRSTITREWQMARTWLHRRMTRGPERRSP